MTYYVYQLLNTDNGRSYIGCTENLERRLSDHFNALKRGNHRKSQLQDDYNEGHEIQAFLIHTTRSWRQSFIIEYEAMSANSYTTNQGSISRGYYKIYKKAFKREYIDFILQKERLHVEHTLIKYCNVQRQKLGLKVA